MNALQSERTWIAGGVTALAVLAAGAWFGVIGPELSHTSSLRSQTTDAQAQNSFLQAKVTRLRRQSENLPALVTQLQGRLLALPVDASYSQLTVQLNSQAAQSHVTLTDITIGGPGPVAGTAGAAPSAAAAGSTFVIPVTLTSTGSFAAQRSFLDAIQHTGPRAALVSSAQLDAGGETAAASIDPGSTMTTKLSVFVTPVSQAAADQLRTELETTTAN
ncbi:MAG TPA: hypothetical protein VMB79_04165 [Jatrophihabitans sp.]|nr:hypothetical protein [Jatrophihabitans sp.]